LTTTGPWGNTWDLQDEQPYKTLTIYLENTELYPGEYAELYSYSNSYDYRMYLKDTSGSKCVGTPDWISDDPMDGAYGIYFTDYQGECAYDDWYGTLTYAEGTTDAESIIGPMGNSWTFTMEPSALYSDYDYTYDYSDEDYEWDDSVDMDWEDYEDYDWEDYEDYDWEDGADYDWDYDSSDSYYEYDYDYDYEDYGW
jgi:hypothetical protein